MATIANLSIGLSADSAKLKKDLNKADAATKKWGKKQKKNLEGVSKAFKGVALAVASIGASAMALRGMTTLAKEISNLSALTNMTTSELQQIEPALNSIGMSTEKYADILKDVNDKMHDFMQTGGGPMVDFFEQIAPKVGITAEAFKGLSGKEGLQLYVDSLQKAGASQEQMTFYMEAIASDSTMLLPLLRNQSAEMIRLGLATDQVIKGSVLADLQNLGVQFQALAAIVRNTITNAFGPLISILADAAEGYRMLITQAPVVLQVLGAITGAIALLTAVMLANPITMWIAAIALLTTGVGLLAKKFFELAEVVGGVSELWTLMKDAAVFEFNQIMAAASVLGHQMQMIFWKIKDMWNEVISGMAISFGELLDSVASTKLGQMMGLEGGNAFDATNNYADNLNSLTDQWLVINDGLQNAKGQMNAQNPSMAKIGEALTTMSDSSFTEDAVEAGVVAALEGTGGGGSVTPAVAKVEPTYFENAAESFVGSLKTSFSDALKTGDIKGFFTSVLDNFTSGIIDSFVEGLFAPLQDSLTQSIAGLFSGVGGLGGGGGGGGGFLSGLFGDDGFLSGLFGAADGGIVPTTPFSKSYADSVPTMLQPGELVVPKDQVGNFMGGDGGGQTFNINVTGDVSRLTRAQIVKMMPEIAAGTNMLNKENGRR